MGTNWQDLGGSFSLWNNGLRASRGVAILFNIRQGVVIKEDKKDSDGRVLSCEIKIENQIYKLINIQSNMYIKDIQGKLKMWPI